MNVIARCLGVEDNGQVAPTVLTTDAAAVVTTQDSKIIVVFDEDYFCSTSNE